MTVQKLGYAVVLATKTVRKTRSDNVRKKNPAPFIFLDTQYLSSAQLSVQLGYIPWAFSPEDYEHHFFTRESFLFLPGFFHGKLLVHSKFLPLLNISFYQTFCFGFYTPYQRQHDRRRQLS